MTYFDILTIKTEMLRVFKCTHHSTDVRGQFIEFIDGQILAKNLYLKKQLNNINKNKW